MTITRADFLNDGDIEVVQDGGIDDVDSCDGKRKFDCGNEADGDGSDGYDGGVSC